MAIKPVAWLDESSSLIYHKTTHPERYTPLYKKREWVGLTDEERDQFYKYVTMPDLVKAIEQALKEKNT